MNSIEDKITRRIYIIIGIVLCFTAVIMYKIQNDIVMNNKNNKDNILDEDIPAYDNSSSDAKDSLNSDFLNNNNTDINEAVNVDDDKLVDVEVNKLNLLDYTDETYWNVILVNKKQPISADRPVKLGTLAGGKQLDYRIVDITNQMISDAARDGVNLIVCSAYRSYTYQQRLFNNEYRECLAKGFSEEDARNLASTEVAIPGTSEHQLGLAIDFITNGYTILDQGFENTQAFKWLNENAHKYGFILRYLQGKEAITQITYEPWHWRYLGPELATKVKESGLCYEEFLGKE